MGIMMIRHLDKYSTYPFKLGQDGKNQSHAESLAFALDITIDGNTFSIPGANVKECELEAFSYGFSCALGFYLPNDQQEDSLIDAFTTENLIEIELAITAVHNLPDPAPDALIVKGLVTKRMLTEQAYRQVAGAPVLYRYYQISFRDPAQVLWQQHYPTELYVDDCMSSVINAQVVTPINLTIDFEPAEQVFPIICLPLGNTEQCHPGETGMTNPASFYDFLLDYTQRNNGFFNYNYQDATYGLSADEPELLTSTAFLPCEVDHVKTYWPAVKRSVTNVLNGAAQNSSHSQLTNTQAVEGVKHDIMLRQSIESRYEDRKNLQSNKLSKAGEQLCVEFCQWPQQTFWPNHELSFNAQVHGTESIYANKNYRGHGFNISIEAMDNSPEKDIDLTFTQYLLRYQVHTHLADSPQPVLPDYLVPRYPLYVEGLIVSEQGEDDEKTFDTPSNDDTGQFEYKVLVPLWDLTIKVMLEPDFLNSHFYFPFYRDTKLLLSLDMHRAHIVKVLNWGEGVQLPMTTQGNHILFGKNSDDQTSLSHAYEDGKPVLAIKRNKENDTELVRLEEGSIILQTCEED
jgi:hypothetical protein